MKARADVIQECLWKLHRILMKKEIPLDNLAREYEEFHGDPLLLTKFIGTDDMAAAIEKVSPIAQVQVQEESKERVVVSAVDSTATNEDVSRYIQNTIAKLLAEDTPKPKTRKKTKGATAPVDKERICSFVRKAFCKILSNRAVVVSEISKFFKQKYEVDLAQALESCGFKDAEAYLTSQGETFLLFEQDGVQMAKLADRTAVPKVPVVDISTKEAEPTKEAVSGTETPRARSPAERSPRAQAEAEPALGQPDAQATEAEKDANASKDKRAKKGEALFPSKASGIRPSVLEPRGEEESAGVAPATSKAPSVPPKVRASSSQPCDEKERWQGGRDVSPSVDSGKKRSMYRDDKKDAVNEVLRIFRERGLTGDIFNWHFERADGGGAYTASCTVEGRKVHGETCATRKMARQSCGEVMLRIFGENPPKRRKITAPTVVDVRDWATAGQLLDEIDEARYIGLGFDAPSLSVACGMKLFSVALGDVPRPILLAVIGAILQAAACRNPVDGSKRKRPQVGGRWKMHTLPYLLESAAGPLIRELTMTYSLAQASLKFEETNADAWSSLAVLMDSSS